MMVLRQTQNHNYIHDDSEKTIIKSQLFQCWLFNNKFKMKRHKCIFQMMILTKKMISQIIQIQNVNYSDVDFGLWNNRSGASNWSAELRSLFASLLSCQGLSCQYWFIHPSQIWINQLPNFFHPPCLEMCCRVREACLTLEGIDFQINIRIFRAKGHLIKSQFIRSQSFKSKQIQSVHQKWINWNVFRF